VGCTLSVFLADLILPMGAATSIAYIVAGAKFETAEIIRP
jgi:hypothetical protein